MAGGSCIGRTVLKALVLPSSQLRCEQVLAWNILSLCALFSQQLVGVSVMPSCVGCSVRILFCKPYSNFQELPCSLQYF